MIQSVKHSAVEELDACKNYMDDIIMLISLYILFCLISVVRFFSRFLGSPRGPSHRGSGPLIISLFFIMLLLTLFCFPPGTLSRYDHPWNVQYAQGLKCLGEYTAISLWKVKHIYCIIYASLVVCFGSSFHVSYFERMTSLTSFRLTS